MFSQLRGKPGSGKAGPLKQALAKKATSSDNTSQTPQYLQQEGATSQDSAQHKTGDKHAAAPNTESLIQSQRGSGQPLPEHTRQTFEQQLGADFTDTRIHTGAKAAQAAQQLNARAFTVGNDVFFGEGEYAPDSSRGKQLLAHELTHVVQQNRSGLQKQVQRDYINDASGNPIAYEFRPGTELQSDFIALAKRLSSDGRISDADLRRLRQNALQNRGTLNDHERMFMAGLLATANVAILNASSAGSRFQFSVASITRARREHVNNLDRELPSEVQSEFDDLQDAWDAGDAIGVMNELTEIEAASERAILRYAGSFRDQAQALIDFIHAHHITASETLQAMINSASDNSRGDRVLAGTVYAIARHAGDSMASRLMSGSVKVDALVPSALAALPGFSGREEAAYVTTAQAGGAKGDTMYVKTDLNIEDLLHRSVVIHELQHATDDAAASATANVQFPIRAQLEANAYRAQARYIYTQLRGLGAAEQATGVQNIALGMNAALAVALVREGITNAAVNKPLFERINRSLPTGQLSSAQINAAFGLSANALDTRLLNVIAALYGFAVTDPGVVDGLAGESSLDWIFRI